MFSFLFRIFGLQRDLMIAPKFLQFIIDALLFVPPTGNSINDQECGVVGFIIIIKTGTSESWKLRINKIPKFTCVQIIMKMNLILPDVHLLLSICLSACIALPNVRNWCAGNIRLTLENIYSLE